MNHVGRLAWYDSFVKNGKSKRNSKEKKNESPRERNVSSEALRGVVAIFLVAFAAFLILAEAGGGGAFGGAVFSGFTWLLGIGYTLLPLSLFMIAMLIFRSVEKRFGWVQMTSTFIFLLSALGLVNLAFVGQGGVLGSLISSPIVRAVDTTATDFFLLAFIIASLIIAFDINLPLFYVGLRERMKRDDTDDVPEDEEVSVVGLPEEDSEEEPVLEEEPSQPEEVSEAPPKIRQSTNGDDATNGFSILAGSYGTYEPPPTSLLAKNKGKPDVGDVKANMITIKRTLQNFGIEVEMDEASIGPTVTRYAMKPAEGVRLSKIVALQSNLELALSATPVRIEAPIPGKSLVGIEVPNIARTLLGLGPLVSEEGFTESTKPLLVALGRAISGHAVYADLAKMPHLLVAGTTGSGKSVAIHDFVISLLYRCGPERLRFIMVDPKRVELTLYNSIPHLLTPVITDSKKCILALKWLSKEMDRRYNILEAEKVRDIASYHQNVVAPALEKSTGAENEKPLPEAMPYIVLIIDELADIMTTYPRELEGGIVKLAQMSRAVGIHLILSTQRPSVKVITGLIKANIPARVALQVASQIDSRTILDGGGAEKLLGSGDMLFLSGEMSKPQRIQASYISEEEVKRVVSYIAKKSEGTLPNEINFDENASRANDPIFSSMDADGGYGGEDDELYPQAKKTVVEAGKASTSYLQRKLGIGYARAAKLIDILEERGVVGPADGSKPRDIIGAGNADELATAPEDEEVSA